MQVGTTDGTFVGTFVVGALLGSFEGTLVGALDGTPVGSGVNCKITGGFRPIEHCDAVKNSTSKMPDDPTIKRAKMATERSMVTATSSNKFTVSLETRQSEFSILFYW